MIRTRQLWKLAVIAFVCLCTLILPACNTIGFALDGLKRDLDALSPSTSEVPR